MDTKAHVNSESDEMVVKKVDLVILLINLIIPVVVISVAGFVMIYKAYWAGLGFFALGIIFWFFIYYMYKIFFREGE